MYHYVRPFDPIMPNLASLELDDFKRQLDYFQDSFGFVEKEEFLESFNSGKTSEGVILTFDDGLYCHYHHVYKELKERGLWGIFYIPAFPYLKNKILDVHRTHLLLGKYSSKEVFDHLNAIVDESLFDKSKLNEFKTLTYDTQINDQYTLLVKRLLNYFIAYEHRNEVLNHLISNFFPEEESLIQDFYLKEKEMVEMHQGGMLIGSHTVNHPVMSRLSNQEQQFEINESFAHLDKVLGTLEVKTFCYPYGGGHSFTHETEQELNNFGCLFSFNVEQRDITSKDLLQRPQALPRYDCNQFKYGQIRKHS